MIKTLSFIVTGVLIGSYCPGNASEEEKLLPSKVNPSNSPPREEIESGIIAQKKLHPEENVQKKEGLPSKIKLQSGRVLTVNLSPELKTKLLEEELEAKKLPEASGEITKAFSEQFKKAQSSRISDRVIGFYFDIDHGKVYKSTFLGRNAK